ncbi:hypothetical protein Back2_07160 [Nocardioides baekrokdamisoli]|uniref:SnoaL-like domain-containing protein n=1 Tax=Nocardioides baekrokdamisoli TaxID=1804624 RepID=A0A3G9J0D1_9ACTN|nr:SgcJ/EcaC family oxidoreductase [Nocardioides baekrokdamisoli]BBH16429.1 hypothetical protein Back2_07160 [Nocardioides baekrokdamisoli]
MKSASEEVVASTAAGVVSAFVAAIEAKDPEALRAVFAEDAVFVNLLGTPMVGRQGIVDGHAWAFAGPLRHSTVALVEASVIDAGDDVAAVHALIRRGRHEDAPIGGLPPGDTRLLLTVRRASEGWIAIAGVNVGVAAPPAS